MLNGYLMAEMAGYMKRLRVSLASVRPHWSYFYNFFKLLNSCIDKEKNRNNAFLLTSFIEYNVLDCCRAVYETYKHVKPLRLHYIQLLSGLLCMEEESIMQQVAELQLLDSVWESYKVSLKSKCALYSACLKIIKQISEDKHLLPYVDYVGTHFGLEIVQGKYEVQRILSNLMQLFRARERSRGLERGETLESLVVHQVHGDFSNSSQEGSDRMSAEAHELHVSQVHRGPQEGMQIGKISGSASTSSEVRVTSASHEQWGYNLGKRATPAPLEEPKIPSYAPAQTRWGDSQPRIPRGD